VDALEDSEGDFTGGGHSFKYGGKCVLLSGFCSNL
jgi:hypothetical protein